ncbi:uncharacterized protein BXZ73DRAFT_5072, partial [Epithele typhae]|uniref:uncharacterized protein n=1 Tax=Epithele typhae TaxID=378194 RepID=UPI0020085043
YVHGDIRPPNVLLLDGWKNASSRARKNKYVRIADFDWAGTIGEARYPCNLSPDADGVSDYAIIPIKHDMDMVE